MGMRQYYVGLSGSIDSNLGQCLTRATDEIVGPSHPHRLPRSHTGVDDPCPPAPSQSVRKEVQALDQLVMVAAEEHMPFGALVLLCITNGKDLVLGELRHGSSPVQAWRASVHQFGSVRHPFCATTCLGGTPQD